MSLFGERLSSAGWREDGVGGSRVIHEEHRLADRVKLGVGTLACRSCDAPVHPGPDPLLATDQLCCPFCDHTGPVRDFLSLTAPARPARVIVQVVLRSAC